MKISVNWIKEYLDFELPPTDELVRRIGSQLGEVVSVVDYGARYQGVVIVQVVECHKLEDSDHLNVCRIDDGGITPDVNRDEQGLVQVVCGAPNVREGIKVAWLPPGSTVPSTFDKDPFVLEARKLRGVVSNGMLASPKELAIGDSHEGILEIDADSQPGDAFAEVYGLNDTIIDVENKMFTHRPDCFGMLGVAREIASILGQPFHSPSDYLEPQLVAAVDETLALTVRNELPEQVPRLITQVFSGITIKPSPVWLQTKLARVGVRPINNVVDITNYIMLLTGQPLHAYDYDKVKALDNADHATLVVRNPRDQERLTLLNGKTIDPRPDAIMIASDSRLIGLGGVMGGGETEVDDTTTNIILECATFDMYSIRRSSMEHGIFSDAVTRFNKGQSPLQNDRIAGMAARLLVELAEATPGVYTDENSLSAETNERQSLHPAIGVHADFINLRLGSSLSAEEMSVLLQNAEFNSYVETDKLHVTAPFWRTDIELREDVVEEIGRLYGFDRLPLILPVRSIESAPRDALMSLKSKVRSILARAGANELLTYSFVRGRLLQQAGQDPEQAYRIGNALSPDLQYYRQSLVPSLLDKIHGNIKAGFDAFALFEVGKAHVLPAEPVEEPAEYERVGLVIAAGQKAAGGRSGAAYYEARNYLEFLLRELGIAEGVSFAPLIKDDADRVRVLKYAPFQLGRSAVVTVQGQVLAVVGEITAVTRKALKLPDYTAGFELDLQVLLEAAGRAGTTYRPLSRFPKVEQDICLRVPAESAYGEVAALAQAVLKTVSEEQALQSSLQALDIFQREDHAEHKQITFRVALSSFERTLTDTEAAKILDQIAAQAADRLRAERV